MEKEIEIDGKKVIVKPLTYLQVIESDFDISSKRNEVKQMIKLSTNLSDEEIETLSLREGIELQKVINEVNCLGSFQNPTIEE